MKNLLKFRTGVIICISILLISIASAVTAKKIAIIDAGSSGSRLWVYDVSSDTVKAFTNNAKGPALSTVALHEDSIKNFLESMIRRINGAIAVDKKDTIDLYVLATAGMRMIPQEKAESIYEIMKRNEYLTNNSTVFRLKEAMTISGQYEGLYAWIAVNCLKKEKEKGKENVWIKEYSQDTQGILEIGGASMQVAFKANEKCVVDTISRGLDTIYSKSYLHYGADQIFEQLRFSSSADCLNRLDTIQGFYNDRMKFVGLSNPINKIFEKEGKDSVKTYSELKYNSGTVNKNRETDSCSNYHPATNFMYITWVVGQLNLGDKLYKQEQAIDWTLGAAFDILMNKQNPQGFKYNKPN